MRTQQNQKLFKEQGGQFKPIGKDFRKKVNQTNKFPYCSVGQIKAYFKNRAECQGTGVLIGKRHVLTVAHNIYSHQLLKDVRQAQFVDFIVQKQNNKKVSLKVVEKYYPQQFKYAGLQDRRFFDIALLVLEQNNIVSQKQCMKIYWNWIKQIRNSEKSQEVLTIGYPDDLNKAKKRDFYQKNSKDFVFFSDQYEDSCKIISKHFSFIEYFHSTNCGQSGSPLIIVHQRQYMLIGLHQGQNLNLGKKLGILLNDEIKTTYFMFKKWMNPSRLNQSKIVTESIKLAQDHSQHMVISRIRESTQQNNSKNQNQQKRIQQLQIQLVKLQQKYEALQVKSQKQQKQNFQLQKQLQKQKNKSKDQNNNRDQRQLQNQISLSNKNEERNNNSLDSSQSKKVIQKNQPKLDLSRTQITDQKLRKLCDQNLELEQLKLVQCLLLKKVQLSNCKKLKQICFNYSNITYLALQNMPNLQILLASYCQRLKQIKLVNCKNIKVLEIDESQIKNSNINQIISQLALLQKLKLLSCLQLKNLSINKLKNLKEIDLRYTHIKSLQFNDLPSLIEINLNSCKELMQIQLNGCQNIKKLFLQYTPISDDQFNKNISKQLPNLEQITINNASSLHSIQANSLKNIKILTLSYTQINSEELKQFCKNLQYLQQINLISCKSLTTLEIYNCKNLKDIDLSWTLFEDKCVNKLCQWFSELQFIKLYQNQKIRELKFKNSKKLNTIIASNTKLISVEISDMTALDYINLNESKQLRSIKVKNCPKITQINLTHTQVDERQIDQLQRQYQDLVVKY